MGVLLRTGCYQSTQHYYQLLFCLFCRGAPDSVEGSSQAWRKMTSCGDYYRSIRPNVSVFTLPNLRFSHLHLQGDWQKGGSRLRSLFLNVQTRTRFPHWRLVVRRGRFIGILTRRLPIALFVLCFSVLLIFPHEYQDAPIQLLLHTSVAVSGKCALAWPLLVVPQTTSVSRPTIAPPWCMFPICPRHTSEVHGNCHTIPCPAQIGLWHHWQLRRHRRRSNYLR